MRKQENNDKALAPATTLGAREETSNDLAERIVDAIHEKWDIGNYNVMWQPPEHPFNDAPLSEIIAQIAPLISSPSPQPQVAEGKEEPVAPSGWIKMSNRRPTEKDANGWGDIWVTDYTFADHSKPTRRRWNDKEIRLWDFWMPIPPVEGQQKDLGER